MRRIGSGAYVDQRGAIHLDVPELGRELGGGLLRYVPARRLADACLRDFRDFSRAGVLVIAHLNGIAPAEKRADA